MSNPGYLLEGSYPSAEVQSVYSVSQADKADAQSVHKGAGKQELSVGNLIILLRGKVKLNYFWINILNEF